MGAFLLWYITSNTQEAQRWQLWNTGICLSSKVTFIAPTIVEALPVVFSRGFSVIASNRSEAYYGAISVKIFPAIFRHILKKTMRILCNLLCESTLKTYETEQEWQEIMFGRFGGEKLNYTAITKISQYCLQIHHIGFLKKFCLVVSLCS